MELTKHHGLGNDFLIAVEPNRALNMADAIAWCDRRTGLGADGLVEMRRLGDPTTDTPALWSMTHWNSDGSIGAVCGNGLRCVGQALAMHDEVEGSCTYLVRTPAGIRSVEVDPDRRSGSHRVRVDMGPPEDGLDVSDQWAAFGVDVTNQMGVSMGNPHLVALTSQPEAFDLSVIGPAIEADFPEGLNVHLIRVDDPTNVTMRIWERGAGLTHACGSGACAVAYATHKWGLTDATVTVNMPGGPAEIEVADTIFLTGPAIYVARVSIDD